MKTNKLPLMMGDKVIGTVVLDYETNKIKGQIDPQLVSILEQALGQGLLEISFYGKPAVVGEMIDMQKQVSEYVNDTNNGVNQ